MNKKTRNIIIIVAILLVVGMAVAYAAISQTLTINGTARVKGNVGVIITNISESGQIQQQQVLQIQQQHLMQLYQNQEKQLHIL